MIEHAGLTQPARRIQASAATGLHVPIEGCDRFSIEDARLEPHVGAAYPDPGARNRAWLVRCSTCKYLLIEKAYEGEIDMDLLDLFERGTAWSASKIPAAEGKLDASTPCDEWTVRPLLEKTGPTLGIAFVDQLVHGWDLAKATGQDATMPADLAQAAFAMIDGRMTDEQRGTFFKPAVPVADGASAQEKLLGYSGRAP